MRIVVLARMTRPCTGKSIYEIPLAGSESALIYLFRELAKFGHKITIFNNCHPTENGIYEGVEYLTFTTLAKLVKFSKENPIDIFISFRDLPAFLFPIKAHQRIWWGHDDFSNIWNQPYPTKLFGEAFLKLAGSLTNKLVDQLFVPSSWMAEICHKHLGIKKKKIWIIRNGIEENYFRATLPREKFRLIYTSNPVRGLDILLEMFPRIKEQIPEAELFLFCGFELWILSQRDLLRAQKLYKKIKMPGVHLMGNHKQSDLARELLKSKLMIYPSHADLPTGFFAETSCISALESLGAGTPVITSYRGGIPEAIQNGLNGILISGDPTSQLYQEKFINETVKLLRDEAAWQQMSGNAKKSSLKYSWNEIAKEWDQKLRTQEII